MIPHLRNHEVNGPMHTHWSRTGRGGDHEHRHPQRCYPAYHGVRGWPIGTYGSIAESFLGA